MRINHSPAIQYAGFGVLPYHSISLCKNASRYTLLIRHSLPIFIAGINCCAIIFRTCCFVVFNSAAVSATVSSSVTPTDRHPFSRPNSFPLCRDNCAVGTDHGRAIPSRQSHFGWVSRCTFRSSFAVLSQFVFAHFQHVAYLLERVEFSQV